MSEVRDFDFQLECPEAVKKDEAFTGLGRMVPFDVVISKEEKEYQRLISEKLKIIADWDSLDSRQFSIK